MTEPSAPSRTARREASRRRRKQAGLVALIALVVLAVIGVVKFAGGGSEDEPKVAQAAPVATTTAPTTVPAPVTTAVPPPAMVATTKVSDLQVFDAPNSTKLVTTFSAKTEYLQPRTLLVVEQQGEWLKTLLPMRPNGSTGWVRSGDVALSQNPYKITVSLADHKVVMFRDGQQVLESSAVIGSDRTPTPLGTYYITDPVDLQKSPGGSYGAFALGLSGYSEVLMEFNGGPGQIAIHGTNQPQLVGQNVSNGCVRVPNDVILEIAKQAPLGTPVVIT